MQALGPLSTGLEIGGHLNSASSYLAEGKYNQAIAQRNAVSIERDGAADESRVRDDVRSTIGQQLVGQAGSGFRMGTGSHADALMQSQVNGMLDALTIRRKAAAAATSERMSGDYARWSGQNKAKAEYFGAAKSLVSGIKSYAGGGGGG